MDVIDAVVEVMIDEPVTASRRTQTGSSGNGRSDQVKGSESGGGRGSDGNIVDKTSSTKSRYLEPNSSGSDIAATGNVISNGASAGG